MMVWDNGEEWVVIVQLCAIAMYYLNPHNYYFLLIRNNKNNPNQNLTEREEL